MKAPGPHPRSQRIILLEDSESVLLFSSSPPVEFFQIPSIYIDQERGWAVSHINPGQAQTLPCPHWDGLYCDRLVPCSPIDNPGQLLLPLMWDTVDSWRVGRPLCAELVQNYPYWLHELYFLNNQPFQSFPQTCSRFMVGAILLPSWDMGSYPLVPLHSPPPGATALAYLAHHSQRPSLSREGKEKQIQS